MYLSEKCNYTVTIILVCRKCLRISTYIFFQNNGNFFAAIIFFAIILVSIIISSMLYFYKDEPTDDRGVSYYDSEMGYTQVSLTTHTPIEPQ